MVLSKILHYFGKHSWKKREVSIIDSNRHLVKYTCSVCGLVDENISGHDFRVYKDTISYGTEASWEETRVDPFCYICGYYDSTQE